MNLKSNIAFAALLSAGLIAMVSGKAAQFLVPSHHLEKDAVTVEATETTGGGAAAVAMPEPILAMIEKADIERGKGVAKACAACHHIEKGGANGVGPGLYGVVGNKKQAHPGYAYSGTLDKQGGDTWTYEELNKFLWKPKAYDKETKMTFVGLKKADDRAAVIAYLRSMDDSPEAAPSAAQIEKEQADLAPADAAADGKAPPEGAGQTSATPKEGGDAKAEDKTAPAAKDDAVSESKTERPDDIKVAPADADAKAGGDAKAEPDRQ